MKRKELSIAVPIAASILLATGSAQLAAQGEEAGVLEEVIVTATKRETKLFDVPMAVQSFSSQELQQAGMRDLSEVVTLVPGASEGRTTNAATRTYQIRGVASFFGESTVGYYVDEVAATIPNRNWAPVLRAFDIERVEVLRGPQGTLYGLGSMGGTIRFITRDPNLQEFEGETVLGLSNTKGGDDNYYADIALSAPIIEDKLAVRFVGSYEKRGGFAEPVSFPGDLDKDEIKNYRVKVLAKPDDRWTVRLSHQVTDIEDDWGKQYALIDPPGFPASVFNGERYKGDNHTEFKFSSAFVSWQGDRIAIESSTGYLERGGDGGLVPLAVGAPFIPRLEVGGSADVFTQEFRVISQGDDPLKWMAGFIYQDSENREEVTLTANPMPNLLLNLRDGISTWESESWAVYGEVSYDLMGGKLVPLVGLRYFEDDRDFTDLNRPTGPIFGPPRPFNVFTTSEKFDEVSPRFNLSWYPSDSATYYLNIARGFRSGTFNTQAGADATDLAGLSVEPDSLWSYEIGGRWNFGSAQLDLAMYYWEWEDQQQSFSVQPNNIQVTANVGTTTAVGLDYMLVWQTPLEGLSVNLSGNFNQTEYDKLDNPEAFAGSLVEEGKQVANVPEQTHNIGASYMRPLGNGLEFSGFINYTYIDKQANPTELIFGDEQNLLRARIGVQTDRWGAFFVGTNLLNHDDPVQFAGSGSDLRYPRTLGAEVNFKF